MKKWSSLVLIVMLAGAFFGWQVTYQYIARRSELSFTSKANSVQQTIQNRINSYIEALYGARGLFMASTSVSRAEWHTYLTAIRLQERMRGLRSLYYAEKVPINDIDSFIESVRTDKSLLLEGYPNFYIFPIDNQPEYYVIKYIEPYANNESLMGFNLASDDARRSALFAARDNNKPTAYATVDWIDETVQKVCFINVPIYQKDVSLVTADDFREHSSGFVGVVIFENDILEDIDHNFEQDIGLHYRILHQEVAATTLSKETDSVFEEHGKKVPHIRYRTKLPLKVADQQWFLEVVATNEFEHSTHQGLFPLAVLLLGTIVSFLVFGLLLSQQKSESKAKSQVEDIGQELSEKETYLEQMIKNAPDPIVSLNLLGFVKDINPAAELISGHSFKDIVGHHFSQIGLLGESSLAKAVQEFALVISGQVRPPFELDLIRRDKKVVWVEAHARRIDVEHQVPHVQVIFRDLTQRKAAEEKLVQIKERLDFAMRSAQMGIWSWNAVGNVFAWDDFMANLLYKPAAIQQGRHEEFFGSIHPDDKARIEMEIQQSLMRGSEFNLEFRVLAPDRKTERVLVSRGQVHLGADGRPQQMIGVCWDATDRKKLQAQLIQAQKMETIGVFSGGIAHDLNNQLTPVLGYLNMIGKDLGEEHPLYPVLQEANQSAKRCTDVIQRLMNFSRASVQKKERVSLKALTDDFKKIVTTFLPATIQFSVETDDPIPLVIGNENELETVLMNLCANARDAMPNGGKLTLHLKRVEALKRETDAQALMEGPVVCLSVTDTGTGMSPEVTQKVFEPFFTTKEKGKGTGLGLAMVFNIIKDHGGSVEVLSEIGKGTTFNIYLPGLKDGVDDGSSRKAAGSKKSALKWTGKALFVDDEDYMRKLGKTYLERLGFEVLLASDGVEGVEQYAAHKGAIKVVVMDMTMPRQTGRATLEKILAIDSAAKIIVASGFTEEGTPEDLIKAGAKNYLQKPYTLTSLEDAIARIYPLS